MVVLWGFLSVFRAVGWYNIVFLRLWFWWLPIVVWFGFGRRLGGLGLIMVMVYSAAVLCLCLWVNAACASRFIRLIWVVCQFKDCV